jgi:hypothetical protein
MKAERLGLEHKGLLYERLRGITIPISEYSFPNLYLFRDVHRYEVLSDGEVFIKGVTYDGHAYLMPTRDITLIEPAYLKELLKESDFLFPVPGEWAQVLGEEEFEFSSSEGDTDYLYTVEKLSTYPGRRLHKKRNLLKQFVASYRHEALPLTDDRLGDARFVLGEWLASSGERVEDSDYLPCMEALELYGELVLCGGIYYAEGEPAGFVLGEELNEETFVLHFAKARTRFKGVYQYMFHNFARVLPEKYRLVNFEQDLEKPALRIAKSSYLPDLMLPKLRVGLRKNQPA